MKQSESPTVSFIIPYFDAREKHLLVNLKSLELQTDKDYEVVLVYQPGIFNPAAAFNLGAEKAKGSILVLTSPEVMNATTNVKYMKELPRGTYWVGRVVEQDMDKLPSIWTRMSLAINDNGGMASCTAENWQPWKFFLGVIHKLDYFKIGGMDEAFMDGIAWEDRDFGLRAKAGLTCDFNPDIVGIHISHPRVYQDNAPHLRLLNRKLFRRKYE